MKHDNTTLRPDLGTLRTEGRNQNTLHIDRMDTLEMVTVIYALYPRWRVSFLCWWVFSGSLGRI